MVKEKIGLIAGNNTFPVQFAKAARAEGVEKIVAVGFYGETMKELSKYVDELHWLKVGQLSMMIKIFKKTGVRSVVMVGQINPKIVLKNFIGLDFRLIKLIFRLKDRRADTVLKSIADEIEREGITLEDSTIFIKALIAPKGIITGKPLSRAQKTDVNFGVRMAKGISGLDIGQTVVVKNKSVVAVEAMDGTDETIKRSGRIAGSGTTVVKVAKPQQDMRFDVPVIGLETVKNAVSAGVQVIALEAGKTVFFDKEKVIDAAEKNNIKIIGVDSREIL
ncbi:MAG: UDP-2,3-diacylglucosamine diphosphatase LpxI [bacterium]|nr:UDP-2,3-diacylglucosamine diphosphatase LpxI [bacterium]